MRMQVVEEGMEPEEGRTSAFDDRDRWIIVLQDDVV